jgi:hypothetical protein
VRGSAPSAILNEVWSCSIACSVLAARRARVSLTNVSSLSLPPVEAKRKPGRASRSRASAVRRPCATASCASGSSSRLRTRPDVVAVAADEGLRCPWMELSSSDASARLGKGELRPRFQTCPKRGKRAARLAAKGQLRQSTVLSFKFILEIIHCSYIYCPFKNKNQIKIQISL